MIIDDIALFDKSATDTFPLIEVKSFTPALNFLCMPNEIKNNIIMRCDLKDLLNLKLVNQELNKLITEDMIITKFCQECEYYHPETFNFENYSDILQKRIPGMLPDRYNKINDYITTVNNNKQQFSDYLFSNLYKAMTNIKRIHLNKSDIKRYSFPEAIRPNITKILLSNCGNYLFTLINGIKIIQWKFNLSEDFTQITEFYHNDDMPNIILFAFQINNYFITIAESGDLKIWYLLNAQIPEVKQYIPNLEHINTDEILAALLSGDNNWLFIKYSNSRIKVLLKNSANIYTHFKNMTDIKSLSMSRDSKLLVLLTINGDLTFNIQNQTKNGWIATSTTNLEINNNVYIKIAINNKDGFCLLGDGYKNIIIFQRINNDHNWQFLRKIKLITENVFPFFLCYQNKFMVWQKHKYLHDDNILSIFSIKKNNNCLNIHNVSIKEGAKVYVDSQSTYATPHPNGLAAICFIANENRNVDIVFFNHDRTYYYRKIIKYLSFIPALLIFYFVFLFKA